VNILNYFRLETVEISMANGDTQDMPALVYGAFAITPSCDGYTVTVLPCGRGDARAR